MTDEREFGVLEEVMAEGCQSSDRTFNGLGHVRNVFDFSQDDMFLRYHFNFYFLLNVYIHFKCHASTGKNNFFRFVTLDICVESK